MYFISRSNLCFTLVLSVLAALVSASTIRHNLHPLRIQTPHADHQTKEHPQPQSSSQKNEQENGEGEVDDVSKSSSLERRAPMLSFPKLDEKFVQSSEAGFSKLQPGQNSFLVRRPSKDPPTEQPQPPPQEQHQQGPSPFVLQSGPSSFLVPRPSKKMPEEPPQQPHSQLYQYGSSRFSLPPGQKSILVPRPNRKPATEKPKAENSPHKNLGILHRGVSKLKSTGLRIFTGKNRPKTPSSFDHLLEATGKAAMKDHRSLLRKIWREKNRKQLGAQEHGGGS